VRRDEVANRRRTTSWAGDASLVAFVILFYANIPTVLTVFHGVPASVSAAIILLLAPAAGAVLVRHDRIPMTATLPLLLGWFAVMTFSAAVSGDARASIRDALPFLTEGLLLFVLVTNAIRSVTTLRRVMAALLLAGALMGGLSLFQEATHSYHNKYLGFAQTNDAGFKVGENISGKVLRPRLTGPIGEQNRYAQVLIVLVPIGIVAALHGSRRQRVVAGAATALVVAGVVLSFSRGAMVAMVPVLIALVFLRAVAVRQLVAMAVVGAVAIVAVAPDFVVRLRSIDAVASIGSGAEDSTDGAVVGRSTSNLASLKTFLDHPLIGVGPGEYFRNYSVRYANQLNLRYFYGRRRAHDLYLEIAADEGLAGLAVFFALISVTAGQLWGQYRYWRRRGSDLAHVAAASLASLVAYLASGVFLHLSYQRYFWFLLAIVSSTTWVLRREQTRTVIELPERAAALPRAA
jgi:O-antigen ligase